MIRELRATDLRCTTCQAAPGDPCFTAVARVELGGVHLSRLTERAELAAAGWQWQEVARCSCAPVCVGEKGHR